MCETNPESMVTVSRMKVPLPLDEAARLAEQSVLDQVQAELRDARARGYVDKTRARVEDLEDGTYSVLHVLRRGSTAS
jgi:hypothetical protein